MFKSVVRGLPSERWHKAAKSSALFSCSSVGFWFYLTMVQRESDCTCDGIITCSFIKDGPVYPIIKGDQKGSNEAPFLYTWRCGYLDTSRSFHSVGNLPKKTRMPPHTPVNLQFTSCPDSYVATDRDPHMLQYTTSSVSAKPKRIQIWKWMFNTQLGSTEDTTSTVSRWPPKLSGTKSVSNQIHIYGQTTQKHNATGHGYRLRWGLKLLFDRCPGDRVLQWYNIGMGEASFF